MGLVTFKVFDSFLGRQIVVVAVGARAICRVGGANDGLAHLPNGLALGGVQLLDLTDNPKDLSLDGVPLLELAAVLGVKVRCFIGVGVPRLSCSRYPLRRGGDMPGPMGNLGFPPDPASGIWQEIKRTGQTCVIETCVLGNCPGCTTLCIASDVT